MKVATWNCQGAVDKKREVIDSLAADLVVIQECANSSNIRQDPSISSLWKTPGQTETKGIGIFGFNRWTVEPVAAPEELPWVLPSLIKSPDGSENFTLLAIWTQKSKDDGRPSYAKQVAKALDVWTPRTTTPLVLAGDFNSSAQGPQSLHHAENVATMAALGLRSTYHAPRAIDHGQEDDMTLKWIGPGRIEYRYHCDFIIASNHFHISDSFVESIWDRPGKQISDHQPVVAALSMATP